MVLSRTEIGVLLPEFEGLQRLMFLVMYGAGLRHREGRRLRVKDVCFSDKNSDDDPRAFPAQRAIRSSSLAQRARSLNRK